MSGFSRPGGGGGAHGGGFGGGGFRGGGYYGHGGHLKMSDTEIIILFSIICLVVLISLTYLIWLNYKLRTNIRKNDEIIKNRKSSDPIWDHKFLIKYSNEFYLKLQETWTNRNLSPVKDKITPSLYHSYNSILNRFKKKGLVNKVTNVVIDNTNIIYFDDYKDDNKDAFAVLIEGTMQDYICREGYKKNIPSEAFRDALVFNRQNNDWILYEIINEPTDYQLAIPKSFIEK